MTGEKDMNSTTTASDDKLEAKGRDGSESRRFKMPDASSIRSFAWRFVKGTFRRALSVVSCAAVFTLAVMFGIQFMTYAVQAILAQGLVAPGVDAVLLMAVLVSSVTCSVITLIPRAYAKFNQLFSAVWKFIRGGR